MVVMAEGYRTKLYRLKSLQCCYSTFQICIFLLLDFEYEFVTCGSSLKLVNVWKNVRLHSHDVKYGSGSGQQVNVMLHEHTVDTYAVNRCVPDDFYIKINYLSFFFSPLLL